MAFDNNKIGELRPNQIISNFGPGSIVDAVNDSVTILDIPYWKEKGRRIIDARLAAHLHIDCFYTPRASFSGDIPAVTFPYWHVCSNPKCARLFDARKDFTLDKYLKFGVTCPECHRDAYPARFVIICEDGHMSDFPWEWWVHRGDSDCKGKLKLYSLGNTSTLADIMVECDCGKKRSMGGATMPESFEGLPCPGHHPFRPNAKKQKCSKRIIPSLRGASNVYFSVTKSAISIPSRINPLHDLIDEYLPKIETAKQLFGDDGIAKVYEMFFSSYSKEEFDAALERRADADNTDFAEIKQSEYNTFLHHADPAYKSDGRHFKAEEDALPKTLSKYFSRIIRVTRLREIRALLGFTRVDASDPDARRQSNIVYLTKTKGEKWLPAAEVNGEGIFIEFNTDTLLAWQNTQAVKSISQKYVDSYNEFCSARGWTVSAARNACYVLLHTFAHMMIKQMALFSGYSASAIRERIYFGSGMRGILLYTGSSDKEGSLGGLVELGNTETMVEIMREAFRSALICTSDPECMINLPAAKNLNGAACHSCCMISETSCENGNRMLDRALVVPIAGREECAYFRELVCELCQVEI